ncbi:DUF7857 domain-containing protein [Halapricum hydrolyticum]|uniref:Uncharacterized protein n=1 Tax=Halapricum hydrolyticum TaxID=2979991 RepID=A0AAE3ICW2_9EURY|nr:hypothetical protein [Halapricum hydrolyticum]MCU4718780.1 hypothetical protein [Halapricum hydrolyticum]MCU4727812.1 hypothetical protein [Halapricum hydrolyticum]
MVSIESDASRRDAVTLVSVRVSNARRTPQRVTIRSRLDGPVWAPRTGVVDAPDWDDGVWTGTIRPGRTRGIGFASPATLPEVPGLDPVELVEAKRAHNDESDPEEVVAKLEGWAPPTALFADEP